MVVADDFFEGAEKVLQLSIAVESGKGLLELQKEEWDKILDLMGAKILSKCSVDNADSYVLNESFMFVSKDTFIAKTCGLSTLLSALPLIKSVIETRSDRWSISNVLYCRKSFARPLDQKYPHNSPEAEKDYTFAHFPEGSWFDFGTNHHTNGWSIFVYNNKILDGYFGGTRVELNMYNFDQQTCEMFSRSTYSNPDVEMRKAAEIEKLMPKATLDDHAFEPCGYSVNGLRGSDYFTLHVTPQISCAYASFETNLSLAEDQGACFRILNVLKPKSFIMTIICPPIYEVNAQSLIRGLGQVYEIKKKEYLVLEKNLVFYCWF
ncbi:S-adenosylmethionine decarboxylase proenzyme [Thelohanellus kitauei]|uniref:S-adenosylmethionine decarboxylase proenzyme n=1 Tax=Thelohanellus kitauei TaxID=669202 RepID=A0A0C2MW88_THEKT|nr:S-adenosylmethionine decarboxylase proenzyme [Thelohanellus kitauei]